MSNGDCRSRADSAGCPAVRDGDLVLPEGTVTLVEYRAAAVAQGLGYFRTERFVILGYCPGGGEVIWKDGRSSGFGTGGWRVFLEEIAPVSKRYEINLGGVDRVGTHVLLIDRVRDTVYAMPRESAEIFLANINSIPLPTRPCLCALLDCRSCPVRTCPRAGRTDPFDTDEVNPALTRAKRSNSVDSRHKSRC